MKLFGKKTLALLLALSMVMSVCVFAEGEDDPGTTPPPVAVTGIEITVKGTIGVGETANISVAVKPDDAADKTYTLTVDGVENDGSITGETAGEIVIVATANGDETITATKTVTVKEITSVTGSVEVAYGTTAAGIDAALDAKAMTQKYDGGQFTGKLPGDWTAPEGFDEKIPGEYTFTAEDIKGSAKVTVKKATLKDSADKVLETVYVPEGIDENDLDEYLDDDITLTLNNNEAHDFDIGGTDADFEWWTCTTTGGYDEWDEGSYTFVAKEKSNDYFNIGDLKVTVVVFDENFSGISDADGMSLSTIAGQIDELLYAISGDHADEIEITAMTGYDEEDDDEDEDYVGGTLYTDEDRESEVDLDAYYDFEDFDDFYFLPNGTGYTTYIYYSAWNDEADGEIEGYIEIEAPAFLLLEAEMDSEDLLDFDSDDFVALVEDSAYDDYDLIYIDNVKIVSGGGTLYYEYDEEAKSHPKVVNGEEYYVDTDKDDNIDSITYKPGTTTSGTVTITFDAYVKKGNKFLNPPLDGIYQINVIKRADITVQAGKEQEVALDYDLFEAAFDDKVSSTYEDYVITAVVFKGAPHGTNAGYLYLDGKKLSDPDGTKFWFDPDDTDEEDLFDLLTYKGGKKDTTTRGEFEIWGKKNTSAKDNTSRKLVAGTIDFVTGAAAAGNTMTATIWASEHEWFGKQVTMDSFKILGGNNNEYVVFTSLPVGGKLVYNWGKTGQKDVTLGTKYYLTAKPGEQLMSNVTFVPSYSANKVQKTIPMEFKAYNAKDKAVSGKIILTVNHSPYSRKFYDITTSTYADSVDFLANQNITTGMTATTFGPNNNVTRAQFVTFLWRAAGSPAVTGVTNKFTDVKSTGTYDYAYQAILWAVQNNITTGRSATKFDPAANVTHQELLTFLYRYDVNYLKHSSATSSYVNYTDYASVSAYAQVPVMWADYKGILDDYTDGYAIRPTVAGTRATVALWLHRMLTL